MPRYAVIDEASGMVVNVIEWDGDEATWQPPAGHIMVEDTEGAAGPGFTYADGTFAPPPNDQPAPADG